MNRMEWNADRQNRLSLAVDRRAAERQERAECSIGPHGLPEHVMDGLADDRERNPSLK